MLSFLQQKDKKIKKIVTLQVRILPFYKSFFSYYCRKRALPSVYRTKAASLTIEAAFTLPMFIFAIVILLSPIKILNQHRKMQTALERSGEEISQLVYAYMKMDIDGNDLLERAVILSYVNNQLVDHLDESLCSTISLAESEILEDGENINLVVEYYVKLPISIFGLGQIKLINKSYRRAWIGKDKMIEDTSINQDDEVIVYIGKNSVRYHVSRTCHYLYNNLQSVELLEVGQYRNQSGSKYKPCKVCGKLSSSTVYIMPSGIHYHSSGQCAAIIAYVEEIELSKVKHLGQCSYCGGE